MFLSPGRSAMKLTRYALPAVLAVSVLGNITSGPILSRFHKSAAEITKKTAPAVVVLDCDESTASGFVISKDGYIVTDKHVVDGCKNLKVMFNDQRIYKTPQIIGTNADLDIAVIQVPGNELRNIVPLQWGNSDTVEPGDPVIVKGNGFGLGWAATYGRDLAVHKKLGGRYDDYIQYDAVTNPGNSGGPVLDSQGRVIGVADKIYSTIIFGGAQNSGVSFATPAELVKKVVGDIIAYGKAKPGALPGVAVETMVSPQTGAPLGVRITENDSDSILQLHKGDIIVRFNNRWINNKADLDIAEFLTHPGDKITAEVWRGNEEIAAPVTMAAPAKPSFLQDLRSLFSSLTPHK